MNQPRLRIYANLSQVILHRKMAVYYRLWTVCRGLDPEGAGWLYTKDLIKAWPQTRRTVLSVLERGMGTFWTTNPKRNRVFLTSLRKLCVELETLPGQAVWLDWNDALKLKSFRASCYGAFFVKRDRTISRKTLSKLYGCTHQAQINWEKERGIRRDRNIGRARPQTPEDWLKLGIARNDPYVYVRDGAIHWQLPNTYSCSMASAPRCSKATAYVRDTLCTERVSCPRTYWDDPVAAHKADNKGRTGEHYYVRIGERLYPRGPAVHDFFFSSHV